MKGGKSSFEGLIGGLLIGKMGGFDEVPGKKGQKHKH